MPRDESQAVESWLRDAASTIAVARTPTPGEVVGGKYRIEALLGRGGMGAVFRARDLHTERSVAIKWMLRLASDEQARRRFEREALAAGRLVHPNVAATYEVAQQGDCCYLVMELLHGESLRSRLSRGPMTPVEAVRVLLPAMRGVGAVHEAGVIHRDLKPDNIFLCEDPQGGLAEAKVLDFGLASVVSQEATDATLTQQGTLLGSLWYMSPEQLADPHEVDLRTDIYAFGVILYETLTGKLPFKGEDQRLVAVAIVDGRFERPSQVTASVPPALEQVIVRALARERADRYPDMQAVIGDLLPWTASGA